ncbi:uncharacterized protein LOC120005354 isoform X2 [Tripterygium wilfordii]|uniref:uncharacterized protein LOC120005354 isoform X2 n=1 Tax=Tripterygium wilfordii TaxID=458696 RepID=UPI0018F84678|nr:uncharacterized protein LOC120005354 isoform X2 [Tripterygium wilfordii]
MAKENIVLSPTVEALRNSFQLSHTLSCMRMPAFSLVCIKKCRKWPQEETRFMILARDELTRETSPLSLEGVHSRTAASILKNDMPNLEQQEHRRNTMKDKGTYSILKYLKSSSPSCSFAKRVVDWKSPRCQSFIIVRWWRRICYR